MKIKLKVMMKVYLKYIVLRVVLEMRRLEFDSTIMDTCLDFSSATLYSLVFSIM